MTQEVVDRFLKRSTGTDADPSNKMSQSTRLRPEQKVVAEQTVTVNVSSKEAFVESMIGALESVKEWVKEQGDYHVRMDLDLLSERVTTEAKLVVFSVDASMLIRDSDWESVKCEVVTPYLRADRCMDGGSENKLFYKHALSLKQFVLHDLPPEEKRLLMQHAYDLFVGENKTPGLSNIQTFSGVPFFHLKPFSST